MLSPDENWAVKTKIVCTLGPASQDEQVLREMIHAGMDVARLNFSHGTHEWHGATFDLLRKLGEEFDLAIMCDIQGPKIRLGRMAQPYFLKAGDVIEVTTEDVDGTNELVTISYPTLVEDINEGDAIYVNDGIVKLEVTSIKEQSVMCTTVAGGTISEHKGVNIPSGNLQVQVPTEKDIEDLRFIATLHPEYVAASFVGRGADVDAVRSTLRQYGDDEAQIISKCERPIALDNFDEILNASDAIMVARGDLGVEIPPFEVPVAQKEMVRKCNRAGRPVIVATQMLESMTTQSRPTRAEANDVFNAVLDGTDAVMLSEETSVGQYPVDSVKIMDEIVTRAETYIAKYRQRTSKHLYALKSMVEAAGHAVATLSEELRHSNMDAKILCNTKTGHTARMISKYRPNVPILAMTPDLKVARQLCLVWGVRALFNESLKGNSEEEQVLLAVNKAWEKGYMKDTDKVITVSPSNIVPQLGTIVGIYSVGDILPRPAPNPEYE